MKTLSSPCFGLQIACANGTMFPGAVVRAADLDGLIGAEQQQRASRSRMAAELWKSRARVTENRARAQRLIDEAVERARADAQATAAEVREQARDAAIDETLRWLVEERQLEALIAERLDGTWRGLLTQALRRYAETEDTEEALWRRLDMQINGLAKHGGLTLRVHPSMVASVNSRLAARASSVTVEVSGDAALKPTQAVLDSPFVCVSIDLERHLERVISAFETAPAHTEEASDA